MYMTDSKEQRKQQQAQKAHLHGREPAFAPQDGMTVRDHFAAAALQGILASLPPGARDHVRRSSVAEDAVRCADALLLALQQE